MRTVLCIIMIMITPITKAQKYFTKTGLTEFKASVEAFEPVEAKNNSTTVVFKEDTGELAALLFVKAFHFEIALMEEHFNENYMDSDEFPKATFKGKIEGFEASNLIEKDKEYILKGILTIKGKPREIETKVKIKRINNSITLCAEFDVNPKDFDIKIPGIVKKKIAEKTQILIDYELTQKK
ncbi:YceI family protein [Aquimarina sp. 2304DJ70-9]|uniref:YceI family protein n=1 Tax=Aquimarina penaris TaxID=3231044 RepID=UPI003462EB88